MQKVYLCNLNIMTDLKNKKSLMKKQKKSVKK